MERSGLVYVDLEQLIFRGSRLHSISVNHMVCDSDVVKMWSGGIAGSWIDGGFDAREDDVDPGYELRPIVVFEQLFSRVVHGRILRRVELCPSSGNAGEEGGAVHSVGGEHTRVGCVLACDAEDVIHENADGVGHHRRGNTDRTQLATDALVNVQQSGPPLLLDQLGADPRMGNDRVENTNRNTPKHSLWVARNAIGADTTQDEISSRTEEVAPVRDVVIERAITCAQPFGEGSHRQCILATDVEQIDRDVHDYLPGQCLSSTRRPRRVLLHDDIMPRMERRSKVVITCLERYSNKA
jgi:hypothetical protein